MSVDADELARLRKQLRSDDPVVRHAAFAAVSGLLGEAARSIVTEALGSDDPDVREAAERLMARLAQTGN